MGDSENPTRHACVPCAGLEEPVIAIFASKDPTFHYIKFYKVFTYSKSIPALFPSWVGESCHDMWAW